MSEWYDEHPEIANLLHHIQDEGTFEEIGNGYIKSEDFKDSEEYRDVFIALSELEAIHTSFQNWEQSLFSAMNKFLPPEEKL